MTKKGDLVVKSNRLVEASYRLTLVEQQIILYAICKSRESGAGLSAIDPVCIVATEFAELFESDKISIYNQLKVALNTLYHRTLKIKETSDANSLEIKQSRWISMQSYIDKTSVLKLIFAPEILPFIKDLDKEFTPYRLSQIGKMSSTHAVRLYELLRQNLQIGSRTLEIIDLKEMLQIEDEYKIYADFKKRVLDVAKKQINDFSDIKVDYKQKKEGRKITALDFKISQNEKEKAKKKTVKKENALKQIKAESYDAALLEIIERNQKNLEKQ
jgi:plasmid replication initiation protein